MGTGVRRCDGNLVIPAVISSSRRKPGSMFPRPADAAILGTGFCRCDGKIVIPR